MGGKKKLNLKQMERMQDRRDKQEKEKQRKGSTTGTERKSIKIIPPQVDDDNVIKEVKRMRVLTPYAVASRFDLRISVAKDFLEELEQRGVVTYVSGDRNIKIYKASD